MPNRREVAQFSFQELDLLEALFSSSIWRTLKVDPPLQAGLDCRSAKGPNAAGVASFGCALLKQTFPMVTHIQRDLSVSGASNNVHGKRKVDKLGEFANRELSHS